MFSVVLSGMFAALTYKGSFFKSPDYFVAAIAGAVTTPVFVSGLFPDGSWIIAASGGYVGGLVGCFVYDRVSGYVA